MKILHFLFILLMASSVCLRAQETNFSNYRMAPLELNPALTGAIQQSNWRVNIKHRRQWETFLSNGGGYETYMASLDRRGCVGKRDLWGVGTSFLFDRAGFSPLSKISAVLSTAYHKNLDYKHDTGNSTYLSLGAEVGYINYRLNNGDFRFDEQFDEPSIPDEISDSFSTGTLTTGIGLYFVNAGTRRSDNAFRFGASIRNWKRPKFIGEDVFSKTHMNWRVNGHVSGVIELGSSRYSVEPSLIIAHENTYWQYQPGTTFLLDFKGDSFVLHAGSALRLVNDVSESVRLEAIVISLQVDVYQSTFSFSYDINTSPLVKVSSGVGAFEFSGVHRFGDGKCKSITCHFW